MAKADKSGYSLCGNKDSGHANCIDPPASECKADREQNSERVIYI